MIRLICVGKVSSKEMNSLIDEYCKRIKPFQKFEIVELKEAKKGDIKSNIKQETDDILNSLKGDIKILFDINGKAIKSEWFAETFMEANNNSKTIDFVICGSDGMDDEQKNIFNHKICFGNVTFPHQLFRVLAVEQIYRGLTINNNIKYHK